MFSKIRKSLGSFLATLLMGLLVASFAVWGIGDVFSGGRGRTVAEVGGTPISAESFYSEYQRLFRRLQQQADQAIDREQAMQLGLHIRVLSQMVDRTLLDHQADNLGLRAHPDQIREQIRNNENLIGPSGEFNMAMYERVLDQNGLTPAGYEAIVAEDIARSQLLDAVTAATPVPDALSAALFRYRNETRQAEVITVPGSAVSLTETPDEETLRSRYDNNQDAYRTPEYRGVTGLFLDPARLAEPQALSEEDLRAAYRDREADYNEPEVRTLQLLTLDSASDETAKSAKARIESGEAFTDVATDLTDFEADELDIGDQTRAEIRDIYGANVAETVFATPKGGVSAPVKSSFGWHLFRVTEVDPGTSRSFEEVRDELAKTLATEQAEEKAYDLSIEVEDRLARGDRLETIAQDLGLPLSSAERVSKEGLNPDGKLVSTQPSLLPVLDQAFELLPSDGASLVDYANNGYAFVRVDRIVDPAVKPFETVRDQVVERWKTEEKRRKAGLKAEALLARLRDGGDPAALAEEAGGNFISPRPVTRDEKGGDAMTPAIAELLFSMDEGQADLARASNGDGYVIVRTVSITPGRPEVAPGAYQRTRRRLNAQMTNEMIVLVRDAIRNRVTVETHPRVIQRLLDTSQS